MSITGIDGCGSRAQSEPTVNPMRWPPMTLRARAVRSNGRAKTMNALAPSAAMTTAFSMLSIARMR